MKEGQPRVSSLTHVKSAQVRLLLPGKDLEGGGLADAVGANESKHLPWAWHGEAVQLEGVGTVPVCGVLLQVAR